MNYPRVCSGLLVLCLAVSLAGCRGIQGGEPGSQAAPTATPTYPPLDSQSASQAYAQAKGKMNRMEIAKGDCSLNVRLLSGGEEQEVAITSTAILSREKGVARMLVEGQAANETIGLSQDFSQYYDGTLNRIYRYQQEKYYYTPAGPEQILAGLGLVDEPEELSLEAARHMTFDRHLDGGIRMDGSVPADLLGENWENRFLDAVFSTHGLSADLLGSYTLGPAQIVIKIDASGYLSQFSASYTASVSSSQGKLTLEVRESVKYAGPDEPVTLEPPADLGEYLDLAAVIPGGDETAAQA